MTHPTAIGQGSSVNFASRTQTIKSSLNPASGSFKNSAPYGSFAVDDPKESSGINPALEIDQSPRTVRLDSRGGNNASFLGLGSRENSLPPSRQSESGLSVASHNPQFSNSMSSYGDYSHTPNSSISLHRPSFPMTAQPFLLHTQNRSCQDSSSAETGKAELNQNLARFSFSEKATANGGSPQASANHDQSFNTQGSYYDLQPPQRNVMYRGITDSPKAYEAATPEGYHEQPFAHQYSGTGSFRVPRPNERSSNSPAGSDYRRGMVTPYYAIGGTPPLDAMGPYRPASRGLRVQSNGDSGNSYIDRKLQRIHVPQAQPQSYYQYAPQFQNQYSTHAYEHPTPSFPPISAYRFDLSVSPYVPSGPIPSGPARDQDIARSHRSPLLDEFRSNSKSNKRYELKDIYNHVIEFSGDQHGSRFIQQKLETANSDEKEQIFTEVLPNALQLMTDVFGNYVIQKLFEHGNQVQKRILAEQMKNHVSDLSLQMYGCRVVQKALEYVLADQQAELVKELQPEVLKCVKDQNGNHVIQKAIERVPTAHIQFIIDAFRNQVHTLGAHPYGCRVIQRMLEFCSAEDQAAVLEELHQCAQMLITDQYGNYVAQHVIVHGKPEDQAKIINIITSNLLAFSKHKFASNVVEKSIVFGTDEQRAAIVSALTTLQPDRTSPLQMMMKDQYGNYVIQKLLAQLNGAERAQFVDDMKPQLLILKRFNYGKQIAAIEKLIFTGPQPPTQPSAMAAAMNAGLRDNSHTPVAPPLDISFTSAAPTPQLTTEANSPQSSGAPSTNVSTVDGPTESKGIGGKDIPELRVIESG